ncbi:MAG: phosphotransferase [Candidatus Faecousia sp.]|nr:phosphotransferase [Bacillota bacterium]MDY4220144.1 phosphotransferase [Candidatus Faecousia sp.]
MSTYTSRTPIHKGWSEDQKYCLTAQDGSRVLLRVSPAGALSRKEAEFRHMAQAAALGVPMCRPLELGVFSEGVYFLQSWIDGRDLEEVLPGQTGQAQYAWGLEAGSILRKLHTIPAPDTLEPWEARFGRKLDRKIQGYLQCPLQYPGGQAFLNHVRENRHLLKNRPQTWQHGDYHTGNMMLGRDGRLYVIDFNRSDYGDPWEEFNRIVWCAQLSPRFASGLVDGYFSGEVPMDFWRLLSLYIASNTLSSLPWAIPFGQGEVDTMLRQARDIFRWYDGMKTVVPGWYCAG